jgi:hypothetical protein
MGMAFALDCKFHLQVLAVQPNALLIGVVVDAMEMQETMGDHSSLATEHYTSRRLLACSYQISGFFTKTSWWLEF